MEERNEFFTNIANENNDELLDELDQMEADNVKETFEIDVGTTGIASKNKDADLMKELEGLEEDEVEDDAKKLEGLMMWQPLLYNYL